MRMGDINVERSIETMKVVEKLWVTDYVEYVLWLILLFAGCYLNYYFVADQLGGTPEFVDHFVVIFYNVLFIGILLLSIDGARKRRNLKVLFSGIDPIQGKQIAEQAAVKLAWTIMIDERDYFRFETSYESGASCWVTVIFTQDHRMLINSRIEMHSSKLHLPMLTYPNERNIQLFKEQFQLLDDQARLITGQDE
jgi:hypothetical protein